MQCPPARRATSIVTISAMLLLLLLIAKLSPVEAYPVWFPKCRPDAEWIVGAQQPLLEPMGTTTIGQGTNDTAGVSDCYISSWPEEYLEGGTYWIEISGYLPKCFKVVVSAGQLLESPDTDVTVGGIAPQTCRNSVAGFRTAKTQRFLWRAPLWPVLPADASTKVTFDALCGNIHQSAVHRAKTVWSSLGTCPDDRSLKKCHKAKTHKECQARPWMRQNCKFCGKACRPRVGTPESCDRSIDPLAGCRGPKAIGR